MAVQPIDLQNLLAHVDQVSKNQNAQRQAIIQNQAVAGSEIAHRSEEIERRIRKTQELAEGPKQLDADGSNEGAAEPESKEHDAKQIDEEQQVVRDTDLGRTIDICG